MKILSILFLLATASPAVADYFNCEVQGQADLIFAPNKELVASVAQAKAFKLAPGASMMTDVDFVSEPPSAVGEDQWILVLLNEISSQKFILKYSLNSGVNQMDLISAELGRDKVRIEKIENKKDNFLMETFKSTHSFAGSEAEASAIHFKSVIMCIHMLGEP